METEQIELLNEISLRLLEANEKLANISVILQAAIYLIVFGACAYLAWMIYRLLIKPILRTYIKFPI